ncbi:MAG TPA: hypothetical protein PK906_17475 [Spirochaetota bacterium]|nr:hypothetical protein [Spirochaetota bacterium]
MRRISSMILLPAAILFIFTSCAKTPEKVISPSLKIDTVQGSENTWSISFTAGIKNENDSTAFINARGAVVLINDSGEKILSVPFKIPSILPFETGVIKEKTEIKGETAEKVFETLSISAEKLGTPDEPGTRFLDSKNVKLETIDFEKKDIVTLLGEKIK